MCYEIAVFGLVTTINRVTEKQESIALSKADTAAILVHLAANLKSLIGLSNICF